MNILNGNGTNPRQEYRIRTKHYIRKGTFRNQKAIFRFRNMRAKKSWKIELKS